MSIEFQSVGIIGTHQNPHVSDTVFELWQFLNELNIQTFIEKETHKDFPNKNQLKAYSHKEIAENCDLAIIVGGDGNFLNAGRILSSFKEIPITGINRGKLGFLTDINPDDIKTRLFNLLKGYYKCEKRFILNAEVIKNNDSIGKITAVNEIVLSSGHNSRLFEFSVRIDNQEAFSQRSDGMIIATPTGSTAHALSAGGSILYPNLNAIELVPMYPHSLTSRPIVISADSTIEITIGSYNNPTPLISHDGHCFSDLLPKDKIIIKKDDTYLKILHPKDYNYYQTLRHKLHWSKLLFE